MCARTLEFVLNEIVGNTKMVAEAIMQTCCLLEYDSGDLLGNARVVMEAVLQNGCVIKRVLNRWVALLLGRFCKHGEKCVQQVGSSDKKGTLSVRVRYVSGKSTRK